MSRLTGHIPVRFPMNLAAAARQCADRDGMNLSAWIRRVVDRELALREGQCQHCGQSVPRGVKDSDGD